METLNWLVILGDIADVASAFPWIVTINLREIESYLIMFKVVNRQDVAHTSISASLSL
jgi:hypothetical protein